MKKKPTEESIVTVLDILSKCEMSDDLRESCFTLVGRLLADKQILDGRAKRIVEVTKDRVAA